MNIPFFSVLVSVYNVELYLDACLDSLVNQTFENYEIVLVDDGSTDRSSRICDEWQAKNPDRIRVVHQHNQGLVMARVAGMRAARGVYFAFVDSDDMLRTDALAVAHTYIQENNADMLIYDFSVREDDMEPCGCLNFRDREIFNIENSEAFRTYMGSTFLLNSICRKVIHRNLVFGDFDFTAYAHLRHGEDLMFSLPMVDNAKRVVYCDQALYYYRQNPTSMTRKYYPGMFRSQRDALRLQREYAGRWDPSGELVKACDRNGLWHFFDDVLVRIVRSDSTAAQKRAYILEMGEDPDFQRNYQYVGQMDSAAAKICLFMVKHKILLPLIVYGSVKNMMLP